AWKGHCGDVALAYSNGRSITGDDLARFGSLAYGSGWQTALAADIGVSRGTDNRWARGRYRISDDWALEIGGLCLARARRGVRLYEEIALAGAAISDRVRLRARSGE